MGINYKTLKKLLRLGMKNLRLVAKGEQIEITDKFMFPDGSTLHERLEQLTEEERQLLYQNARLNQGDINIVNLAMGFTDRTDFG